MLRRSFAVGLIAIAFLPVSAQADAFDNYLNTILKTIPESKSAEKVSKLTHAMMVEHGRVLPGVTGAFIVVKTNDNRFAKVLVQAGEQKFGKDSAPIVIVDRYVTYREGEDRTIVASGHNVRLFGDFLFNLDLGQVVPAKAQGDLRVIVDKDGCYLEPVGKAEMYLVTKHLTETNPKKSAKVVVSSDKFEMRYFNGNYKLYDDGRRSGTLHFKVADNGDVVGHYYSDKDGAKYEVSGKVPSNPTHMVNFLISYPRSTQTFVGFLFTGDARALVGTSRLLGNETGFYAVRTD